MRHPLFERTKYFIFDMDGTFYLGDRMIPGAGDFARSLKAKGLDYRFFTNNSSNNEEVCMAKLARMGFPVEPGRVVLSSDVAADYLNTHCPGAGVYLLGNERLTADMLRAGIRLVQEAPDLILLGFDTTLTFEKITKAANWIAAGLPYYATHPDRNCPMGEGFWPDTGSMIALFEASAGRRPVVLGKPMRTTVDYLTRRLNCAPEELVFVGDRLETDIAIGAKHGIPSVLVLSGVTSREDYEAQTQVKAGLVVESMAALVNYI
ncbi:MAG: HAD-IIA family hydrolase [Firmicutes bacterium]|nr:HAD-IIA family hydrolase [Bacillota bacterium]